MRALVALAALAALAACGPRQADPTTIEARDSTMFQPVLRASVNFAREPVAPSNPQGGHGLELGYSRGRGSDSQTTRASEQPVVFGGQSFASPQDLRHDFDFRFADVSYRWRRFFGPHEPVGFELLAGLGYAQLDLTVSSATQRAQETLDSTGAIGQFGGIWRLRPGTSVQGRLAWYFSGADDGVANAQRLELFLVQALGRNLALRGGYASWHVETDRGRGESNINMRFSGPALGLDLMF